MTSKTLCVRCGAPSIKPLRREGRTTHYRTIPAMDLPCDYPLPTCTGCGAFFVELVTTPELRNLLASQYLDSLRLRVRWAIDGLCPAHISQRHLELRTGLSQGYLSKLRSGAGNPSAELTALLALLALNPSLLSDLERFWALSDTQLNRDGRTEGKSTPRLKRDSGGAMTAEHLLNLHRNGGGDIRQTARMLGVSRRYAYQLVQDARSAVSIRGRKAKIHVDSGATQGTSKESPPVEGSACPPCGPLRSDDQVHRDRTQSTQQSHAPQTACSEQPGSPS